ncbi:hypothetical protein ACFLZB_00205 [Nanoarchaeota archaeon]
MAKVKAKVTTKVKKKYWFPIIAPKQFHNKELGEIHLINPEKAINRTLRINLQNLTESMRDQNVYIKFRITSASGNNLNTEPIGYFMVPASIKRMVRRHSDRIDESFVIETADKKKARFKFILVTLNNTKRSVNTSIRKALLENISQEIPKMTFEEVLSKLIPHRLQNELKKKLSKVYPVKIVEVKHLSIEKEKLGLKAKKGEEVEEKPKKEKIIDEKIKTPKEAVEKVTEKAVEEVVEKVEKLPEEEAEKAAEELVEEKPVKEEKKE